jgi:hypothetical protein
MRNNIITLSGIGVGIALFAAICVSVVRPALALVDASSSPSADVGSTTVSTLASDAIMIDSASSTDEATATTTEASGPVEQAATTPAAAPPPIGLTEVHIVGTKYTDYFTDGTTVASYPGDPAIDSNFDKPDAPIPTHAGLTWDHTSGYNLYDTASGDLDVGDYAVQSDGSYIENAPPFVSSTSTPAVSGTTDSASATPAVLGASTSTVPAASDNSTPPGASAATDTGSTGSSSPDTPESNSAAATAPATTTGN